jgi:hypothetical protein
VVRDAGRAALLGEAVALARVHLAGGRWLTLRAARVSTSDGTIAVTLERPHPTPLATVTAAPGGGSARYCPGGTASKGAP